MKVGIMLGVAAGTIATYAIMSENKDWKNNEKKLLKKWKISIKKWWTNFTENCVINSHNFSF